MPDFTDLPQSWPVTLEYGPLRLRPLKRSDRWAWEEVRDRSAAWLAPWEATLPYTTPGRRPSYRAFVRWLNRDGRAGRAFPWGIFVQDQPGGDHFFAGQLVVGPVTYGSTQSAPLGYWIDQKRAGQGITPLAVAMATDYLLKHVGLHRVEINIVPRNAASLRVVEKLGFRYEGLRKNYLHINGVWEDHSSFALTQEDLGTEFLLDRFQAGQTS